MGLSLTQVQVLLTLILGLWEAPSRTTIGRWVEAAGEAAGRVLKRLDALCKELVLVGCLDEIFFHGRAVLVGVEPASMVWFLGTKVAKLRGSVWAEQLQAWDALQHVIADAGKPLQNGIAQAQEQRRQQGQAPLASTLDVFHTKHEAQQALTIDWNQVERDWEAFEKAEDQLQRTRRGGIPCAIEARKAGRAWAKVVKSFNHYEAIEAAWKHAASGVGGVPARRPTQRSSLGRGPGRRRPAGAGRSGLGAGRQPLANPGELHLLGSIARCVGVDPGSPGTA